LAFVIVGFAFDITTMSNNLPKLQHQTDTLGRCINSEEALGRTPVQALQICGQPSCTATSNNEGSSTWCTTLVSSSTATTPWFIGTAVGAAWIVGLGITWRKVRQKAV
jgi:hypothetical protein